MEAPSSSRPDYKEIDGIIAPVGFSTEALLSALQYKPLDGDFFIVTYPKCGTTWCQQIVSLIINKGKPYRSYLQFELHMPYLEKLGNESAIQMKRPGAIKTHLPFSKVAYSKNAKYLYVARNPKDALVSFYHHQVSSPLFRFPNGDFNIYFEEFIKGKGCYNDYFDHHLGWYEHRNDPNVLFFTFEEMRKEPRKYVLKIAEFMGECWLKMLQNDETILDNVIKYSSVAEMKKLMNDNNPDPESERILLTYPGYVYVENFKKEYYAGTELNLVRSGRVGGWKEVLTPEQNRRLDELIEKKLKGTSLYAYWKEIDCI